MATLDRRTNVSNAEYRDRLIATASGSWNNTEKFVAFWERFHEQNGPFNVEIEETNSHGIITFRLWGRDRTTPRCMLFRCWETRSLKIEADWPLFYSAHIEVKHQKTASGSGFAVKMSSGSESHCPFEVSLCCLRIDVFRPQKPDKDS